MASNWKENLSIRERAVLKGLYSPLKIQAYLDTLKINFEKGGDTCSSPRVVLKRGSAHCIEAALLAAAAMIYHGQPALLLDLKANDRDFDHVVALFKRKGRWGAISKSNHMPLRYRDPVYLTVRELAMSYFNEYVNDRREKTMRSHSPPFSLKRYGYSWITSPEDLWQIANELDEARHFGVLPKGFRPRKVDKIEWAAGQLDEWSPKTGNLVKY